MPSNTDDKEDRSRLPHAVLDEQSRILKARKIIALVGEDRFFQARRILEIGCGSGVISSTLARLGQPGLAVHAVDVTDSRIVTDGYEFVQVKGTELPFESESFDIVITNHVIEHVGDTAAQLHHLTEISRVLRNAGCAYLAVPNKWRLVEPHYRLPLLSWLPLRIADKYLRLTGRGSHYDCVPLSNRQARNLFELTRFKFSDLTTEAVRETFRIEFPDSFLGRTLGRMSVPALVQFFKPLIPTIMFRLEKRSP